ncbi:sigma-70 family RNA polymerase sigma factor [Clostridium sp. P21]|uniref:Sigma-70 family RNA polymerase sigma factor n=1 Tax=Clostridium muellerianum TaxID=2716538 RepID=A0A7Y0HQE5_9CLOT|nr:sigma-70 family RNA polymerase sigma factor [Clostridium muellerianum]NMM64066.1 sigma-70 family RNA polymerase sigma factor [Clostridium muellerianum]
MNDIDRVIKAQKGDDIAFSELIKCHKENLYKIAFAYLKNEQEALDVVGDTIYKVYIDIDKLKNPEFFKTWITRIVINNSINRLKKNNRVILIDEYEKIDNFNFNDLDIETDIPKCIDLYNAIDSLNVKSKTIIILKYFQDMTISEISKLLEIPEGTVKVYIHRALKKLKIQLREEFA